MPDAGDGLGVCEARASIEARGCAPDACVAEGSVVSRAVAVLASLPRPMDVLVCTAVAVGAAGSSSPLQATSRVSSAVSAISGKMNLI